MSKADIEAQYQRFSAAVADGDTAALQKLYTKNARLLAPNAPQVEGADIAGIFQAYFDAGAKSVKLEVGELHEFGDSAVELGTYRLELEPPDGSGVVTDEGKYIVFWKKEDGEWKLDADCWNSNLPAPS